MATERCRAGEHWTDKEQGNGKMGNDVKLKVYLETSFVSYLTGGATPNAKIAADQWNCKHMANPHTLPKTRQIIAGAGFFCPAIMTPKTFIENTEMEVQHV